MPVSDNRGVLVRYRPTWRQAAGRGLLVGLLLTIAAVAGELLRFAKQLTRWSDLALLPVAFVLGAVAGTLAERRSGLRVTGIGLRAMPGLPGRRFVPWGGIRILRAERRGNRTVVVCHLDGGGRWRLPVPYDGDAFARDAEFDEKMFTIRTVWEAYRGSTPDVTAGERQR